MLSTHTLSLFLSLLVTCFVRYEWRTSVFWVKMSLFRMNFLSMVELSCHTKTLEQAWQSPALSCDFCSVFFFLPTLSLSPVPHYCCYSCLYIVNIPLTICLGLLCRSCFSPFLLCVVEHLSILKDTVSGINLFIRPANQLTSIYSIV